MSLFARGLDPFNDLFDLQRSLGSTARGPEPRRDASGRPRAYPPVNVFRNEDGYLVRLEVPGVAREDLSIEAAGRTLTVAGQRVRREAEGESTHRLERKSGEFSRAIRLPEDADCENIEATLKSGILSVQIHHNIAAKPRQISVSVQ